MSKYETAPMGHVQALIKEGQKPLIKGARERYYKNYDRIFNKTKKVRDTSR